MKVWFLTDTARVAKERAAVEALAAQGAWFTLQRWRFLEGRLCAEGEINAHGFSYPVRLLYPDQFPQVPAWVEPQDSKVKWSHHQYGEGGPLCLELRPDTWVETATGADVLASAYRLLELENPLGEPGERGEAPSAARVGAVQSYGWFSNPLFVTAGCLERIRSGVAAGLQSSHSAFFDGVWPFFVHDEDDRATSQHPPLDGQGFSGTPVYLSRRAAPAELASGEDLRSAAGLDDEADAQLAAAPAALVLFSGAGELSGFLAIVGAAPVRLTPVLLPENGGYRSGRASDAAKKHVAIVGAGSVGSKLAESLVRSGVRRITLVDGDVMLPANLERHALDWRDVGYRKVQALKRRLTSIAPGAQIKEVPTNLSWQRSARTHAWQVEAIANCDVIVDATGDVPTTLFLGAVAAANRRPFVSIEVFEGGIGALIASCVPKRDPPYGTARAAFESWCEKRGEPAPKSAGRPYEALSDEGTPFVADDAAVTMAAGHGARVVLDIVDGRPAAHEAAWMLIGFQKAWVFDGHCHTIRMSVGAPEERAPSSPNAEVLAFVAALMNEVDGEGHSSE